MTAYRQQALGCAVAMLDGPKRPRDLKALYPDAPKILLSNVYGWFGKVAKGTYEISDIGRDALVTWQDHLPEDAGSGN